MQYPEGLSFVAPKFVKIPINPKNINKEFYPQGWNSPNALISKYLCLKV